ncbi:ATP-dependent RNA helicase HrpA [Salinicola avicenniae]|uniref:ATP-dependent RNA helicase HrpA n=1 Tax=Salinicola avicenniae TaxID=2916836 RepID=UPI00207411C6|nr:MULTISPECIES: ATP-dependent RNA helicase HrpA [unclassified Salinicola]
MSATASHALQALNDLQRRLDDCLLRDAHEQRRRLERLARRARDGKPIDRALKEIESRLEASHEAVQRRRRQPVKLDYPESLPVASRRETILDALREHQVVVVAGETGSGKTTQLPKLCLELGLGRRGMIGHTQPRRLAARSVAARLAEELEVPLGEQVGYQVRFTDQSSDQTLVKLMTDGILLAETQHDPDLMRYEAIIIDEAHERSLNIDFLLGYLKRLTARRPDLKVIITSATIDVDRLSRHFAVAGRAVDAQDANGNADPKNAAQENAAESQAVPGESAADTDTDTDTLRPAPVVEVSGRAYPVEVRYRPLVRESREEEDLSLQEGILAAVEEIEQVEREHRWYSGPRDILIFLPGEREIRETADVLRRAELKSTEILPLYARLSNAEQNRVFQSHAGRRIVLSTNVAETSLTVPGIRYVIDPGLVRMSRYSFRAKVQRLPIEPVSQASADQRKGRCGRVAEGVCIRLYSEEDFLARPAFTEPEIQRTNLASVILSMLALKLGDVLDFPFVDAPDPRFVKDGYRLLFELGAVDAGERMTDMGRRLSRLPIDPRLGRMVLAGEQFGCLRETLIVVSALATQDPRDRPAEKRQAADQKHKQWEDPHSDFVAWWNLWQGFEAARETLSGNQLRRWCRDNYLSYLRLREWHDTYRQLRQLTRDMKLEMTSAMRPAQEDEPPQVDAQRLHQALLAGLLSNLGQLQPESREFLGARNRKFLIHPASGLSKKPPKWVMAGELVETSRLYARDAARIQPEWIEPQATHLIKRAYSDPHWERKRAQVVAQEQVTLFGLPIVSGRRVDYAKVAPAEARELFIRRALVEGDFHTRASFFAHNRAMMAEVEDLEDRARKRDILVDEETLFAFYDERIPAEVASGKHFESWRKRAERETPDILKLDKASLMAREADDVSVEQYPDELVFNGVRYPLSYHFAPGASDDGVTLTVPAVMLAQLPAGRLSWMVPGLLRDKCIALLKGLPKTLRRQIVPIPDWVDAALATLTPDERPVEEALGEFLRVKTGTRLDASVWDDAQLEPHLIMNLRVVDHHGKVLGEGRDLQALQARFGAAAEAGARALAETQEETVEALESLPEAALPDSRVTSQAGIQVEVYPAAVMKAGELSIAWFDHEARARAAHRDGLIALARQRLPEVVRYIERELPQLKQCALLFAKTGSREQLARDVIDACLAQTIAADPLPRSRQAFDARLEQWRGDLVTHAESVLTDLKPALEGHLAVTKSLKGNVSLALALTYSDLRAQMQRLVYPGFVREAGAWLKHYPRYMQAAEIRLEKAPRDRRRDQLSMQQVQEWETRLDARREATHRDGIPDEALVEFGWWLQEWRVSLFAQQLGTLESVSEKRLARRWQEITGQSV